jgi:hypothetical protein
VFTGEDVIVYLAALKIPSRDDRHLPSSDTPQPARGP